MSPARSRPGRHGAGREADLPALQRGQPQRGGRGDRARTRAWPRAGARGARGARRRGAPGVAVRSDDPTGEQLDAALIERICAACPGIVVLDQAYLELGGEDFSPLVARNENLVVTRTFSKGFALGAARVGYGLAQPALAGARRAAPARLDLVLVRGRRRAGLQRDRRAAGALRRHRRGARVAGRRHSAGSAGSRRARTRRQLRARALAGTDVSRAWSSAAAPCAHSGTSHC